MAALDDDERGVSEGIGIAILVGMTVVVTATVGLNVLVVENEVEGPPDANFTFDHDSSNSVLVITHSNGDSFPAGELLIEGSRAEVTWAAAANTNESQSIGPGSVAQISRRNAYGRPVTQSDTIRIYHDTGGNRTQLDEWP